LSALKNPKTFLIILLGILPAAAYLFYGLFLSGFLGQQFGARFYPQMWVSAAFYLRWFLKASQVTGTLPLALALLAGILAQPKQAVWLASLGAVYLLYGFTFSHHIASHDYYSLPLLPLVALSLALLSAPVWQTLRPLFSRPQKMMAAALLLLSLSALATQHILARRATDWQAQAQTWANIGEAVQHQPGVIALTTEYAYPLAYYGWQNADSWLASVEIQNFLTTWKRLTQKKDYFLVTDFAEFTRQPQLQDHLYKNYPLLSQSRDYILFDLAHPYAP
jgi:hypothetical protein